MARILVVEDDPHTQRLTAAVLKYAGYDVVCASDGIEALELFGNKHIDLVVLDLMLPRMSGIEVARTLRDGGSDVPILMLTALDQPRDRRLGFHVGTDDYLVKPADEEEMLLRIKALLRRARVNTTNKLRIGEAVFDKLTLTASRNGCTQELPPKEFQLAFLLLSYPNQVFTRLQIMEEIWGLDSNSTEGTVNTHINRLRRRFEDWPEFAFVSIRGIGYKAVAHVE